MADGRDLRLHIRVIIVSCWCSWKGFFSGIGRAVCQAIFLGQQHIFGVQGAFSTSI